MNVFIVHAHPEPKSFSSALCSTASDHLRAQGHEVRVSDLYAIGFNPVASAADFENRKNPDYLVYALEQRHANATDTLPVDVRNELAKLLWCDLLILNFPVFWFSTPAILKGWIDRVFVSGLVYGGKRFYDRGGLLGKRVLLCATIGGQEHMLCADGIHGPLNDMLRPLLQGTLAYAGMRALPPFVAWHVPYINTEAREAYLHQLTKMLDGIDTLEPLSFPKLGDFDEQLRPLRASSH
jgi:NAD(P)H dehydrogenase (quinone)